MAQTPTVGSIVAPPTAQAFKLLRQEKYDEEIELCDEMLNSPSGAHPIIQAIFLSLKGIGLSRLGYFFLAATAFEQCIGVWNRVLVAPEFADLNLACFAVLKARAEQMLMALKVRLEMHEISIVEEVNIGHRFGMLEAIETITVMIALVLGFLQRRLANSGLN
ncbi:hypothetical protein BJ508DRAFT_330474 [Ascobolus immersus RN42]|uniref:Uncharacterized protein n=1 Tax=Ascobolus immersus RN42 TaxID=1160509 RepID=A0A3N4HVQ1_ASCIM|nr:hypothetical protein BJ508DRAFT_330474 [Ascobolus immersus RN42]